MQMAIRNPEQTQINVIKVAPMAVEIRSGGGVSTETQVEYRVRLAAEYLQINVSLFTHCGALSPK